MSGRKGKGCLVVILLFLLIIALGVGGVCVYLFTDLFKTPEQLFKKYLILGATEVTKTNIQPYNDLGTRLLSEPTEATINFGMKQLDSETDIKIKYLADLNATIQKIDVDAKVNDEDFFDFNLYMDAEMIGLKVDDLHDKYFALENAGLQDFAKNFVTDEEVLAQIPDSLFAETNPMTQEEKEKMSALGIKYLTQVTNQIGTENYIVENNITATVNGASVTANKYTVSMKTKDLLKIISTEVNNFLNDPEFLTLYKGDEASLEEAKTSIKEMFDSTLKEISAKDNTSVSLYVSEGKNVKTELAFGETQVEMTAEHSETESILRVTTNGKSSRDDVGMTTIAVISNSFVDDIGTFTYDVTTEYNQDDIDALQAAEDEEYEDFSNFRTDYSERYKNNHQKFTMITEKGADTYNITFDNESDEETGLDLGIETSIDIMFGAEVEPEAFSEDTAIILNDYDQQGLQGLLVEIMQNAMMTAIQKPNSLVATMFSSTLEGFGGNTDEETEEPTDEWTTDEWTTEEPTDEWSTGDNTIMFEEEPVTDEVVDIKPEIQSNVKNALEICLRDYQLAILSNQEPDIGDYLTIDNIQNNSPENYALELIDGNTIKCTVDGNSVYYAIMEIDGGTMKVSYVDVYTEQEYFNR